MKIPLDFAGFVVVHALFSSDLGTHRGNLLTLTIYRFPAEWEPDGPRMLIPGAAPASAPNSLALLGMVLGKRHRGVDDADGV